MHDFGSQNVANRAPATSLGLDEFEPIGEGAHATARKSTIAEGWRAELGRLIQAEIVPRLLVAHNSESFDGYSPRPYAPAPGGEPLDVVELSERLRGDDDARAWEFVAALARQGRPTLEIFVDLLAPVARRLGQLWETDECDFIEVTIGLRRLTQILRRLSPEEDEVESQRSGAPRALLLPTPGESHVFGIAMVEAFFRADGWRVTRCGEDFPSELRRHSFDVVGFSLSASRQIESLAAAVREARSGSRNRAIRVLVGGPIFASGDELVARVGADAGAADAPSAIHLARNLLRRPVRL